MILTQAQVQPRNYIIWLVGVSFLLFQFFLQLSSGIIIGAIMQEQSLSAFSAGLLSSSFYYVYTSLQIPVGILFDKLNTRNLLFINAGLCALGCFIFAASHSFVGLFIGRLIIGGGSAFAFIGMSHILREHFPLRRYAFMIGLSETLGFTMTVLAMIGMGSLINDWGWRSFINSAGFMGFIIAFLCWKFIPNHQPKATHNPHFKAQLLTILKNKFAWFNGIFVGLEFSVITVFAALWAVPFLQLKLNCDLNTAGIMTSMILLGAGLSCPLFGFLSVHFNQRKTLIHASCLSTALLMLVILYTPLNNLFLVATLMFLIGLCCGAYMLAYSIANELAPAELLSTSAGFTNTLAMLSAPLLQPLIGFLLDCTSENPGVYSLADYQTVLLIIPICLIFASWLMRLVPENTRLSSALPVSTEERIAQ